MSSPHLVVETVRVDGTDLQTSNQDPEKFGMRLALDNLSGVYFLGSYFG